VPADRRDPSKTSTRGTGQLILAAVESGCQRVIVGIGGSATNDGGAGLATALGYRLLDTLGEPIEPTGGGVERLDRIDQTTRDRRLDHVEIVAACDVDNPLCGPRGASAVFGPQKGAGRAMVDRLDQNLAHLADVIQRDLGVDVLDLPGAGAAGGLGAGLVAFARGQIRSGIDLVLEAVEIDRHLATAVVCFTGEGAIDSSSTGGKVVAGLARRAQARGRPVIALAGTIGPGAFEVLDEGVTAIFSLCTHPMVASEAMSRAAELLEAAASQATRAFRAGLVLGRRWANST
jgi:glycerate kinase